MGTRDLLKLLTEGESWTTHSSPDKTNSPAVAVVSAAALGVCIAAAKRPSTLLLFSVLAMRDSANLMGRGLSLTCVTIVKVTPELHLSRLLRRNAHRHGGAQRRWNVSCEFILV
jgi:hypothetical protein